MCTSDNSKESHKYFQAAADVLEALEQVPTRQQIGPDPSSTHPALLLNVSVWNQSMLLRLKELGHTVISLWHENRLVSAAILTRCLLETVALYYHIRAKLEDAVKTGQVKNAVEHLWRAGRGRDRRNWRLLLKGPPEVNRGYEAIELEDFRKALTEKSETLKYSYSELSEYVHPNSPGTSEAYANPNRQTLAFIFDGNYEHISHNVGYVLEFGVRLFELCWRKMEELIPRFMDTCRKTLG